MTAVNVEPQKKTAQQGRTKRSPLAGWFGRRADERGDTLPEMDVGAGVDRALRLADRAQKIGSGTKKGHAIRDALSSIEGALAMIDTVRDTIEQAYEVALSARDAEDAAARSLLAESYDELRFELSRLSEDANENAGQLIGKEQKQIDVRLGGQALYSVSAVRLDTSAKGLSLSPPRGAFETDEEIDQTLEELDRAIQKADRCAVAFCQDARFLIARLQLADGQPAQ
ncbi:MAG: hypothetical protein AAF742_05535 [Pseudomonadota bacterium]